MKFFLLIGFLVLTSSLQAQTDVMFKGRPSIKISEGGSSRVPESIDPSKAVNVECIISKTGNQYIWSSRNNTPLTSVDEGAFITFIALNGSGYVRITKNELKQAASLMSETESSFDYVEHLLIGLRSVTYYGKRE